MKYKNVRPSKFYIGGKQINEIADANTLIEQANQNTGAYMHGMRTDILDLDYVNALRKASQVAAMVYGVRNERRIPQITKVIFNNPATIVFWSDETKTVVKAHDEAFDKEKGLSMAIAKKAMGNQGNYFDEIKKWTEAM